MKQLILGLFLCSTMGLYAQNDQKSGTFDSRYLEDQFYLGITYNFFRGKPVGFTQRNLSYGLHGGVIKDMPVNSRRTLAIGIGLGYAVNSYYSNLWAFKTLDGIGYSLINDDRIPMGEETVKVERNKLETHVIELPFELRWRNSTPEVYRFTRIYAGMKFGYIFASRSKLVTSMDKSSFTNPDVLRFQYGITLNIGYNTFNAHVYYSLSGLFEDGPVLGAESIDLKPIRVGFVFYIL
ncbi:MAG: hypothetical protein CR994_04360 [Maribacter sp.]|nr:MAG: hypothetical protein CR994_04360 [Maribacter sp.]